jgi:hypothetical protein
MREAKTKKRKLIFVESTESPQAIKKKIADKRLATFDLWVRSPDSEKLDRLTMAARQCSCRRVCQAIVEDEY